MVDSEAAQEEVWGLQGRLPPEQYASLLDQLGVVYGWLGGSGAGRPAFGLVEATAAR